MSVRIAWDTAQPNLAYFKIESAYTASGPWTFKDDVVADRSGPNYDTVGATFFYVDLTGTDTTWYHVISVDRSGLVSAPSVPMQAVPPAPALDTYQTRVTADYPSVGDLKYVTASGAPVVGAFVRAFYASSYGTPQGVPLAVTKTLDDGSWQDPIYLEMGYTYVIEFAKQGAYGPDSKRIVL
jgi:hypothetical protein